MALEPYRQKRDFTATPEPRGRKARRGGHAFVIQKHAATRLHYDLRLEMDGVLKSWAVTRGPSLSPEEKRLAVQVEDHPLDYGAFEGTIPKGQYGGGSVILWDRGTWTPVGDAKRGYAKGHLEFELAGEKLRGRWHLVRMQKKPGETRDNWLLIKGQDQFARKSPDILKERPESVKSGLSVEEIAKGAKPRAARKTRGKTPAPLPDFVPPALATLRAAPPSGPGWLHEIKFDGYRLEARIEASALRLLTRSGLDWTRRFGSAVPDALRALPVESALLDGELVVEGGAGASDFSALQADLSAGRSDRFVFYLFDLLYLDGTDLRAQPLTVRKAALENLLGAASGPLRFSSHFDESGAMVLRHACRLSLEGIVSKRADAAYPKGRSNAWIKSKCSARQEFVVAGYVPSTAAKDAIGSLVLGVYQDGGLVHVGRVGTGFSHGMAADLFTRLQPLARRTSPFAGALTAAQRRGVRFVSPDLVAEVEFRAWTADGHLRHAVFRGLREDKPASDIIRETAAPADKPPRRRVALTHPDRVYWPEAGVTKEALADYYADVWRRIAPFVTGRPLALLRGPTGTDGQMFFQKHLRNGAGKPIIPLRDPKGKAGAPLIGISDLDGLMALVQAAALEIHPWGASADDLERPDMITMDLDPGDGVDWPAVAAAAHAVRARLQAAGLEPFVKTSGGKGLHVVAPLVPQAGWPAVKAFTKAMAESMAKDSPDQFTASIAKTKRRGRILIDYLRNQRGATAVAAYSTRARPGAPVSMPLAWQDLDGITGANAFDTRNAPDHLAALAVAPWGDFRAAARPLPQRAKARA